VWNHPVGRVRAVGLVEGVSFLLLLCVAMPLKRFAGMPEAVTVVGWAHGLLFMLYVGVAMYASYLRKLSRTSLLWALGASVVPLGPFLIDRRLKREEATVEGEPGASATG
jgi:integral membrane protein